MKYIKGYNKKYCVTENGEVWSNYSKRFLTVKTNRLGYKIISLYGTGKNIRKIKTHYIHRLVAKAFVTKNAHKNVVNHIDGNQKNNNYKNLEWCTQKENIKHAWDNGLVKPRYDQDHPRTKLSNEQVKEIRNKIDFKYGTMTRLAKEYNVSISLISLIGKNYRYV